MYLRLNKGKEKEFIRMERELYDFDPREMFEIYDNSVFVSADKFIIVDEIHDEDTMVYHMPEDEKDRINKLTQEYDSREPFDVDKCKMKRNCRTLNSNLSLTVSTKRAKLVDCIYRTGKNGGPYLPNR
ncbi:MAG: hypothetical protein AB7V48_16665 [Sedimentibacter sp.]